MEFMPLGSFIQPISVKTYLKYIKYYENFNFARYNEDEYNFKELNDIDVPLFMRWGNVNEMIEQKPDDLVKMLNQKIKIKRQDINYIDGANHSYEGKKSIICFAKIASFPS